MSWHSDDMYHDKLVAWRHFTSHLSADFLWQLTIGSIIVSGWRVPFHHTSPTVSHKLLRLDVENHQATSQRQLSTLTSASYHDLDVCGASLSNEKYNCICFSHKCPLTLSDKLVLIERRLITLHINQHSPSAPGFDESHNWELSSSDTHKSCGVS